MIGLIVTLLVGCVSCETHSLHYQRHVSRKSRSNAAPFETEYIYNQVNNEPEPNAFEVFAGESDGASGFNTLPVHHGPSADDTLLKYQLYNKAFNEEHSDDHFTLKPNEVYDKNLLQKLNDNPSYDQSSYITYDMPHPTEYVARDFAQHQVSDVSTEKYHNFVENMVRIETPNKDSMQVFPNYQFKNVQETTITSLPNKEESASVENNEKNRSTVHSYSDVTNKRVEPQNSGNIIKSNVLLKHFDKWPSHFHEDEYKSKNISHTYSAPLNISKFSTHNTPPNFKSVDHSFDFDYARQKAEAKLNHDFMLSKLDTDALYERLKSLMHYTPPTTDTVFVKPYHSINDYSMDDNDIRTGWSSSYGSSPYYFSNAYELEHSRSAYEMQNSKDKRYAIDRDHIPVHESMYDLESVHPASTPENPVHGDQPFFSFVLNDYFQKDDDDHLHFKDMDTWGENFDYEAKLEDSLRNHNLPQKELYATTIAPPFYHPAHHKVYETLLHSDHGDSATEKGYTKSHEYDTQQKGDEIKSEHHSDYKNDGKNYKGFKDFVDLFVNKFGKENVKKDSKYKLQHNQDKGEKKKGFRKVYHKDEYQEEDEYYDNSNKNANAEESGSLAAHNKAVEAFLKSHAGVNLHDVSKAHSKAGNLYKNNYEKNHSGHGTKNGLDNQFRRYQDEAKKVAHNDKYYNDNRSR